MRKLSSEISLLRATQPPDYGAQAQPAHSGVSDPNHHTAHHAGQGPWPLSVRLETLYASQFPARMEGRGALYEWWHSLGLSYSCALYASQFPARMEGCGALYEWWHSLGLSYSCATLFQQNSLTKNVQLPAFLLDRAVAWMSPMMHEYVPGSLHNLLLM